MDADPAFLRSDMNEVEKANADLVLSYFKLWEGDFNPAEAFGAYFAPDARLRYESGIQSPVQWDMNKWHIGADDVVALNQMYVDMGWSAVANIHDVFACGPMVVVHRTDITRIPDMPNRTCRLIGVFMVINGRIVEWSDYYGNRTPSGVGTD